jgi:hypothetical protein
MGRQALCHAPPHHMQRTYHTLPPSDRHHVFLPAGKAIPPGAVCPVCDWKYDAANTKKVRVWDLETRVANMMRNPIVVEVVSILYRFVSNMSGIVFIIGSALP